MIGQRDSKTSNAIVQTLVATLIDESRHSDQTRIHFWGSGFFLSTFLRPLRIFTEEGIVWLIKSTIFPLENGNT